MSSIERERINGRASIGTRAPVTPRAASMINSRRWTISSVIACCCNSCAWHPVKNWPNPEQIQIRRPNLQAVDRTRLRNCGRSKVDIDGSYKIFFCPGLCRLLRSDFAKIGPNMDDREHSNLKEVGDDNRAQPHHRSS